jgi:hypothetical protein
MAMKDTIIASGLIYLILLVLTVGFCALVYYLSH